MNNFLKPFSIAVKEALAEFKPILENSDRFYGFLLSRGWLAEVNQNNIISLQSAIGNIITDIEDVIAFVKKIENSQGEIDELIEDAIPILKNLYVDIKGLDSSVNVSTQTFFPLNENIFWTELSENLFDDILITYLEKNQKILFSILHFAGIVKFERINPSTPNRIPYYKKAIEWDKLGDLITDPTGLVKSTYSWGSTSTDYDKLFMSLERIFRQFYISPRRTLIQEGHFDSFFSSYSGTTPIDELEIPFYEYASANTNDNRKVSLSLSPAKSQNSNQLKGVLIVVNVEGVATFEIPLSPEILLKGQGYFASDNFIGFAVYPDEAPKLWFNPNSSGTAIGAMVSLIAAPKYPWTLFGSEESTRLMLNGIETSIEVRGSINNPEFIFKLGTGEVIKDPTFLFVFEPGEGDGFINKILGKKPFHIFWGIGIKWSSEHGISFDGSGGFEIEIPLNNNKKAADGPDSNPPILKLNTLRIGAGLMNGKFGLSVGLDIAFKLGCFDAVITDIGGKATLEKKANNDSRGILNNLDFKLGFKAPKGIGISVKASVIEGGGYLYIDTEKGRYAGAIELTIKKKISLTAIGIITTKNPDGTPGFSLLILISVTFPGIAIGFGFTLNGVGGMVGVNRSMNPEPIRLGVKTGGINNIMFPQNVLENIQTIITDLEQFFPIEKGRYTFGIFFLLKWGVGLPIVNIKIGVIISVPNPVRLAIIGVINVTLPDPKSPALVLNVAFAGIVDFEKKYLTFDASIFDSRILVLSLSGDMAVRIFWGEHREMLMSVGGFHPSFNAPAYLLLPAKMDRLAISLSQEDYLTIRLATYFAVTSNTVQFGVRLDMALKVWKLNIIGYFGFDVLFQFDPFKFMAHVYAGLAVLWGERELLTITLDFTLDGPGPWHAVGKAEFKVLKTKQNANFDKKWGENQNTIIPSVELKPQILAAIQDIKNWEAIIPVGKTNLVQIKPLPSGALILNPLGALSITQKIAPLKIGISRYGAQIVSDAGSYDITEVKIGSEAQLLSEVKDNFAMAQFREMQDADKLKAASFEYQKSGVQVTSTNTIFAEKFVLLDVDYDAVVIDAIHRVVPVGGSFDSQMSLNRFTKGGLVASSELSRKARQESAQPTVPKASIKQEKFRLASKDSLLYYGGVYDSLAQALTVKQNSIQSNPSLSGRIEAIPYYA